MKSAGLFISFVLILVSTQGNAQEKDFCARLHSVFSVLEKNEKNAEVMNKEIAESGERYTYHSSKDPLHIGGKGLFYTEGAELVPVGYEERMSEFTTRDEADKIYAACLSDLKKCLGAGLKESVNTDPSTPDVKKTTTYAVSGKYVMKMTLKEGEGNAVVVITVLNEK